MYYFITFVLGVEGVLVVIYFVLKGLGKRYREEIKFYKEEIEKLDKKGQDV